MRKSLLGPVALAAVFAVAGCSGSNRPAATQSSTTSRVTSSSAAASPSPATRTGSAASRTDTSVIPDEGVNVARPVKGVLLNVQAIGSLTTQSFRAPATWHIAYQADCSNTSGTGAFQVALVGAARKVVVSIGAESQTAVVPEHGAGTYHFVITTPCDYLLQALPGAGT